VNSATQKNWALPQIQSEWVLQIDSDEVIEPPLANEIQDLLSIGQPNSVDGYRIPRKNLVWGRWVQSCGTYPDHQLRLFRAKKGRWSDREVHARVIGLDDVRDLNNHLLHYDYEDISQELTQFARQVVRWESNELFKNNRRWRWLDVTARPIAIFFLLYLGRGGYRDGFRGFFLSVYRAFYSFMTYARLYELEIRNGLHE